MERERERERERMREEYHYNIKVNLFLEAFSLVNTVTACFKMAKNSHRSLPHAINKS